MRQFKSLLPLVPFLISVSLLAQSSPDTNQGLQPYATYGESSFDSVSYVNGNLTLHIPLVSYPQRGNLKLDFFAVANGKNWSIKTQSVGATTINTPTATNIGVTFQRNGYALKGKHPRNNHPELLRPWVLLIWNAVERQHTRRRRGRFTRIRKSHPEHECLHSGDPDGTGLQYNGTTGIATDQAGTTYKTVSATVGTVAVSINDHIDCLAWLVPTKLLHVHWGPQFSYSLFGGFGAADLRHS